MIYNRSTVCIALNTPELAVVLVQFFEMFWHIGYAKRV